MWKHSKYKSRTYEGFYITVKGEREFRLVTALKNGKTHSIAFESPAAAKGMGWKCVKPKK